MENTHYLNYKIQKPQTGHQVRNDFMMIIEVKKIFLAQETIILMIIKKDNIYYLKIKI
jgi:hypothetical protein